MEDKLERLAVEIPETLKHDAEIKCAKMRNSLKDYVQDLIERDLAGPKYMVAGTIRIGTKNFAVPEAVENYTNNLNVKLKKVCKIALQIMDRYHLETDGQVTAMFRKDQETIARIFNETKIS